MRLRTATKIRLSDEPELFGQVLARMMGAWDAEDAEKAARPPKPWEICREMGLSYGAMLAWVAEDDQRTAEFEHALSIRAHLFAEETIEIADDLKGNVGRSKLQIEARKWLASRHNRKMYGEQNVPPVAVQVNIGDAAAQIAELEKRLGLSQPAILPATIEHGMSVASPTDRPAGGDGETPAAGTEQTSLSDPAPIEAVPVSEEYPEL